MILGRPVMLILAPLAAAFVVLSLRGRGYGRGKLLFLGVLRTLLVVCAALAVSKVSILLPTPKRHVVFLIDASASCADRLRAARALVKERIERLGPHDIPTVLLFDRRVYAASDEDAAEGRRLPDGTDISTALEAALAAVPTACPGAVFLLTDGIETQGDSSGAALQLAARGIPVTIPRPSTEPAVDVRVAALDAPSMVDRGQSFRLTCRIEATRSLSGELKVTQSGKGPRMVAKLKVRAGKTFTQKVKLKGTGGKHKLQAQIGKTKSLKWTLK